MMVFRRLYWVTEEIEETKKSGVKGVYTSIPDLIDKGLPYFIGRQKDRILRLSLVKLDSDGFPLECWYSPKFENIEQSLTSYVKSRDFSFEEVKTLVEALKQFAQEGRFVV